MVDQKHYTESCNKILIHSKGLQQYRQQLQKKVWTAAENTGKNFFKAFVYERLVIHKEIRNIIPS